MWWKNVRGQEDAVTLGKIVGRPFQSERLTEAQLNHHVHIVGASGFGKSVLLSHIIRQRIAQGKGLLVVDLKSDMETIAQYASFAAAANRDEDVQMFSLSEKGLSTHYNLLSNGTATQLRDRIMASLIWSEEYYKNQSASYLLKLLIGLCWLRDHSSRPLHLGTVHKALNNTQFVDEIAREVLKASEDMQVIMLELVAFAKNQDHWASLQGLRTQIESIVRSDFGELVSSDATGIDLHESIIAKKLVFLFLDTRRYGDTAKTVGRFILQDLKATSARVDAEIPRSERQPFSVIIDEFADLAQEDFIGFLDRARSSRMSVVVAHQEICDLQRISPEFAGRLMGNTSTLFAFLQKRPESAEIIAGIAGTKKVKEETEQFERVLFVNRPTGLKSVKEVESYIIHPNEIKAQRVGECVVVKKYPRAEAYKVRIYASES